MRAEELKSEIRKLDVDKRLNEYDQGEVEVTEWRQVHEDLKNSYN